MSTTATFASLESFEAAIKDVRNDQTQTTWVLAHHVNNDPAQVDIQETGSGDLSDLVDHLNDKEAQYALIRLQEQIDMSVTTKFVYIHWMGTGIGFASRGRFGVVHGSVQAHFAPYHLMIETSSKDDLDQQVVTDQLASQSGQKQRVLEVEEAQDRPARGFTSSGSRGPPTRPLGATSSASPSVSRAGASVSAAADVSEAFRIVRSTEQDVEWPWTAAHFPNNDVKQPLAVLDQGSGNLDGLRAHMTKDTALFALTRTVDVVDDIPTVKYIQITWVGDGVKPMAKAKIATQKGGIMEIIGQSHLSVQANGPSDISEHVLKGRIAAASGSKRV